MNFPESHTLEKQIKYLALSQQIKQMSLCLGFGVFCSCLFSFFFSLGQLLV
jgi:hypothetical protein